MSTWLGGELRVSSWLVRELKDSIAGLGESSESVLEESQGQVLAWERVQSQHLA